MLGTHETVDFRLRKIPEIRYSYDIAYGIEINAYQIGINETVCKINQQRKIGMNLETNMMCKMKKQKLREKKFSVSVNLISLDVRAFHIDKQNINSSKMDPLKMVLTLQERIFIVENVFRDGGKYTKEVQESFQEEFGAERLPHRNCVSALLHKFKKTGSVQDKPKSGRPKVVTDTVLQNVTNKLQRSPRKSLRRLSQETRISLTSTHRAVHQLKFFPYKVHVVHELKPQDSEKRVLFCRWFENFILEKGENILNHTFFSDEAWFHLSGNREIQRNTAFADVDVHPTRDLLDIH
ncbi:Macrophage migration inhibitory factor-like [Octopus vulgaris]|uniref:Macrophage migration inhibitory factor-like n=1 Tax=Octopus vulgaris TaxID=6645 RepID=A0AA36FGJ6_OCTVU|nr:Macrophage migration inhibitory factor-like [Octopus vulgaris]